MYCLLYLPREEGEWYSKKFSCCCLAIHIIRTIYDSHIITEPAVFKQTVLNPRSAIAHLSRQNLFSPLPLSRVASNSAVIANAVDSVLLPVFDFLPYYSYNCKQSYCRDRNERSNAILFFLFDLPRAVTSRKTARKDGEKSDIELTFNCEFLQLLYDLRRSKLLEVL